MTAQEYIISTLEELAKPLPKEDIGERSVEDAIFTKLMSKKFRKLKADDEIVEVAKKAIQLAVREKKPITISILFGGNKLWRFEEAPEIDWAEFFSLIYFVQWMKSIASVYKPGARLDYYSQDISVESLNNVPRSETNKYSETFLAMLQWIAPYIPDNVQITYRRHLDEYDNLEDYYKELEEGKKIILADNHGRLPELDNAMKAATELNVKLKPGQNDDPSWREKVELEHQAIFKTKSLQPYLNDPYIIPACPTYYSGLIVTGSTKRSYAKFWAAVGALEKLNDSYNELVLTPKQLETTKFTWEKTNIPGLNGKNFKKIRIVE